MSDDRVATARLLYETMARRDVGALLDLLTEDFVGSVSAGMPFDVGGVHRGPTDMVVHVWGRIAGFYDIHVDPEEFLDTDDGPVVVLGRYRGTSWDDSVLVDASFAHVIAVRDGKIAALQQITDTRGWRLPKAS